MGGPGSGPQARNPEEKLRASIARVKSKIANKRSDSALSSGNSAEAYEHDRAAEAHDTAASHHEAVGNHEEAALHREVAEQHRNLGSLNTSDLSWAPDRISGDRALRSAGKYRSSAKEAITKIRGLNKIARAADADTGGD